MNRIELDLALMDAREKHRGICEELKRMYLRIYTTAPDKYDALQAILIEEDRATLEDYRAVAARLVAQLVEVMRLIPPEERKP